MDRPAPRAGYSLDAAACRVLWCEVLRLAIDDLRGLGRGLHHADRRGNVRLEAWEAHIWLGSRDFHHVCALAGVDGRAVIDRMRPVTRADGGATA